METSQMAKLIESSAPTRAPEKNLGIWNAITDQLPAVTHPALSVVGSFPEPRGPSLDPNLEPH
jgi:hypothetical protein